MKKFFLVLGLAAGLCFSGTPSQASTHTTLSGGLNCVCQDADNWVDVLTPGTVSVSCPGVGSTVYRDTQISASVIREYSCSTFSGATTAAIDNITGKVIVSYVDKTCPKGHTIKTLSKTGTASSTKLGSTALAYCAPITVKPEVKQPSATVTTAPAIQK